MGADRRAAGSPRHVAPGKYGSGDAHVRIRRRPGGMAPHARATPPERREEVLREPQMTQPESLPANLMQPEAIAGAQSSVVRLVGALRRVMLGKEQTIDEVVAALLARGHVLLEGLPGLGKTELVKALSRALSLGFRRIQFTPD